MQTSNVNIIAVYNVSNNPQTLNYNNVYVQCNISTAYASGTNDAAVVEKNIQTSFETTNSLGGMSIIYYDLETNNGFVPVNTNYGLILGITIPLVVLFLAGLIYFICASFGSESQPSPTYTRVHEESSRKMTYELKDQL